MNSALILLGGVCLAAVLCLAWAPPTGAQVMKWQDEKAMWEEHFRNVPDLAVKGSGWKPWNRWLWFYEPRVDMETGYVPQGARWNAYLQQQEMLRQAGDNRTTNVWTALGPTNIAGRATPVVIDPKNHNRLLVGSASGGLWESLNAGQSWQPIDDQLPSLAVGAILFDSADPNTIYMGTGEGNFNSDAVFGVGVLQSTDDGATWAPFGTGLDWSIGDGKCVEKLVQNPNTGQIIAATTSGIYQLLGTTWTRTLTGTGTALAYRPDGGTTWYCGLGNPNTSAANGVYVSTDDGATWTKLANGFPTSLVGRLEIAEPPTALNTIYCGISKPNGNMLGIYKTTDAGANWTLAYNAQNHYGSQGWYDIVLAVDPTNANLVFSGGIDIWASTDGAASFTHRTFWNGNGSTYVHADQHGWAFHPDNHAHVYATCDGGIFESTNSGVGWTEITTGMETMQFYDVDVSQTRLGVAAGGAQDNGSSVTLGTPQWNQVLGGDGFHANIDWAHSDTMYMEIYYGDHYRTYNHGLVMAHINTGIGEQGAWDTPVLMDAGNTAILYTAHRKIYKTTNRGQQWVAKSATLPGQGVEIAQSPSNNDILYAGYISHSIFLSTDHGETWTQTTASGLPGGRNVTRVAVHPTDPATVFITLNGYAANGIWKSTDSGATFTSISGDLPALPLPALVIDPEDPDMIYVGSDLGCWRTETGGAHWLPYGTGLPNGVVADLKIMESQRLLFASVYGRGLWKTPLEGASSTFEESPTHGTSVQIVDVFPNPLGEGRATVRFSLPRPGRVQVQLFDASGRLIEAPVNGSLAAGTHRVEWTSRAPSGVYFVRVRQGRDMSSSKLTIQR